MSLQIRRGTEAQRTAVTFDSGEPAWVTDTQTLYVGDGSTAGGVIPKARTTGAAGGDLTGTYPDPTVAKIRGNTVQAGTPSNNQSLVYKTATGQWELANPAIAGSTVASGAVSDGDNLIYNASTGQWEHAPDRIGNRTVSATAPTAGQTIIWNSSSSQWEPAAGRIGTTAISATAPSNNQVLLYNSSTTQWEPGNCRVGQYAVQNVAPADKNALVYNSSTSQWEPKHPILSTVEAFTTADFGGGQGAWTTVTGASVSLAAGTWLVTAHLMAYGLGVDLDMGVRIHDGTNAKASGNISTLAGFYQTISMTSVITLAATTTINLQINSGTTDHSVLYRYAPGSARATGLTAVRIA